VKAVNSPFVVTVDGFDAQGARVVACSGSVVTGARSRRRGGLRNWGAHRHRVVERSLREPASRGTRAKSVFLFPEHTLLEAGGGADAPERASDAATRWGGC
jgi:hypothetical protein